MLTGPEKGKMSEHVPSFQRQPSSTQTTGPLGTAALGSLASSQWLPGGEAGTWEQPPCPLIVGQLTWECFFPVATEHGEKLKRGFQAEVLPVLFKWFQ